MFKQLLSYGAELPYYKEPIEASPKNPLYKSYPLVFLSPHSRARYAATRGCGYLGWNRIPPSKRMTSAFM